MKTDFNALSTVLITDCGSTTTKALLFEKKEDGWHQTSRGEAPTTVEAPVADVTVGALNSFREVQELSGRAVLGGASGNHHPFVETGTDASQGIDLYLSTSSAGGGLQMLVGGLVREMTAESAQRAALGAGAIVMETLSADDGREEHEKIERIRHLRPDIVLITGGVDGGSRSHVIELAELLLAASPRPRFGETLRLPVIYAGNKDAADDVARILAPIAQVQVVPNVRPTLEEENLGPAREAIHDFFLTHVMSHSPGYGKLLSWTPEPVMPTPAAVGVMIEGYAKTTNQHVLCADIGGATTDVFSVFKNTEGKPIFNRTVSANYGMSYSVANVLVEAGADAIKRWLPYEISDSEVRDRLRNKMIRPTTIPETLEDLLLEQAVCREALRLSLDHHRSLAVGLSGVQQRRGIADIFTQRKSRYELVDLFHLDLVIGSGGVLSHAPHRLQAALMMLDGFGLRGITHIAVDSIFMLPHLGVFSTVHPQAAQEIFLRDCLVPICHSIVPVYAPDLKKEELISVSIDDETIPPLRRSEVRLHSLSAGHSVRLQVTPLSREIDIGAGGGEPIERQIVASPFGLLLDGRNRPILHPSDDSKRREEQAAVLRALGLER